MQCFSTFYLFHHKFFSKDKYKKKNANSKPFAFYYNKFAGVDLLLSRAGGH